MAGVAGFGSDPACAGLCRPAYGVDAQRGDPAANLTVGAAGFEAVGRQVAALDLPTVLIQEGGYLVERLGANLTAFLTGLGILR